MLVGLRLTVFVLILQNFSFWKQDFLLKVDRIYCMSSFISNAHCKISLHDKMSLPALNSFIYLYDVIGIPLAFFGQYRYFIGCIEISTVEREW